MSIHHPEITKLCAYLKSIDSPSHILLIYDSPSELEALRHDVAPQKYAHLTLSYGKKSQRKETTTDNMEKGWVLRHVVDTDPSRADKLVRTERRLQERRIPPRIICAYRTQKILGLGEDVGTDIFSAHDYILVTRFSNGGITLLNSTSKALSEALGNHGAEMIHRYMEREGIERGLTPLRFRQFLDTLQELLGSGAEPLTMLIYRRLFQNLRSNQEGIWDESREQDQDRDPRPR